MYICHFLEKHSDKSFLFFIWLPNAKIKKYRNFRLVTKLELLLMVCGIIRSFPLLQLARLSLCLGGSF